MPRHTAKRGGIRTPTKLLSIGILAFLSYMLYSLNSLLSLHREVKSKAEGVQIGRGGQLRVATTRSDDVHVIFSTDCSPFQSWQSFALFHSAMVVKQPGDVTRIVSGCTDEEHSLMQKWHDDYISPMSPQFHVHFTPAYDHIEGEEGSYKFFNKPFGTLHFLNNAIGLTPTGEIKKPDTVFVLIDPDEFFLAPIRNDFSDQSSLVRTTSLKTPMPKYVTTGHPIAQQFGLGGSWTSYDLATITGDLDSPAKAWTNRDAAEKFAGGPPYLATGTDMLKITKKWSEFVRPTHKFKPGLLAEMYAWCIAAAHVRLPHILLDNLMVSNINVGKGEGWPLVDSIPAPSCALESSHSPVPTFLHLCQYNRVGDFAIHKRKIPRDIFSCESPMLADPPPDLGENFLYKTQGPKGGQRRPNVDLSPKDAKRTAFQICAFTRIVNDAAEYFKKTYCSADANYARTWKEEGLPP